MNNNLPNYNLLSTKVNNDLIVQNVQLKNIINTLQYENNLLKYNINILTSSRIDPTSESEPTPEPTPEPDFLTNNGNIQINSFITEVIIGMNTENSKVNSNYLKMSDNGIVGCALPANAESYGGLGGPYDMTQLYNDFIYQLKNQNKDINKYITPCIAVWQAGTYISKNDDDSQIKYFIEDYFNNNIIDIFVNNSNIEGDSNSYDFYSDIDGKNKIEIAKNNLTITLDISKKYRFSRINNNVSHPFYISDEGYKLLSSKIIIEGDGNESNGIKESESFILSFKDNFTTNDKLYYYCTSHNNMYYAFNLTDSSVL
jgi:hypothetical protein